MYGGLIILFYVEKSLLNTMRSHAKTMCLSPYFMSHLATVRGNFATMRSSAASIPTVEGENGEESRYKQHGLEVNALAAALICGLGKLWPI